MTQMSTCPRERMRLVPEAHIETLCRLAALIARHDPYILPKFVLRNRSFSSGCLAPIWTAVLFSRSWVKKVADVFQETFLDPNVQHNGREIGCGGRVTDVCHSPSALRKTEVLEAILEKLWSTARSVFTWKGDEGFGI